METLLIQPRVAPISKAPCTRDAVRSEARSFVAEALAAAPGYSAPSTAPPEVEKWKRKLQTALAMLPCELKPRLARVVLLAAKLPLVAALKSPLKSTQGPTQLLPAAQLGAGEQPPVSQVEWGPQSWAELLLEDWAVSRLEPLQQAERVLR